MGARKDLTGQRFGCLTVIAEAGRNHHGAVTWVARCACGKQITTTSSSLSTGNTASCGCARQKHGKTRTSEWSIWQTMLQRCLNPNATSYEDYGGRGITVCEKWRADFSAFLQDVGPRPSPRHSLDRIDANKNYEPGNVRWATPSEQALNKRTTRFLEVDGVRKTLHEWSAITGVGYTTMRERIRRGWSASRVVTDTTK
jgi:hypothetical protein